MNKRSFLKSILVAAVAPSVFLPKLPCRPGWKRSRHLLVPNPEWETAPYEMLIIGNSYLGLPNEERLRFKQENGVFVPVYSHIVI